MLEVRTTQDVQDMARGAVFLGAGGGGDPYVGELFVRNQIEQGRYPRVIALDALADDAFVVGVAGIGAPTVLVEQLVSENALVALIAQAERLYGRAIDAIFCVEIGGCNSMVPLGLGARLGLPVIDADGMGRAFPHLEMTSFSVAGHRSTPAALRDDRGNEADITLDDDRVAERVARGFASSLGGLVHSVVYPMSGAEIRASAIPGTLTATRDIGRTIRGARSGDGDPTDRLIAFLDDPAADRAAARLFSGKIVDITHETRDGWHWGTAVIDSEGGAGDRMTIGIQNEFVVARRNGETVISVPDIIVVLDQESAEPLTAEQLRYGQRVHVIGYAAAPLMRRPEGLAVFGPRAFGIAEDYRAFGDQAADAC
ncbi:DUF917 domain-containing protein [Sphingomonas colocasiae]|uniref:DUF917 domain-containing protein n=1 Tax=Sphingomonas colocasiae TaxID=1848973 RepID=A0ABS7PXQ9_9SPHN|nr:DUF917 domain-containing protein [Sphingomonas colocasiae]MBY8825754.1 DUF917 domain-containing protein [Sphingomonas colocasiae]